MTALKLSRRDDPLAAAPAPAPPVVQPGEAAAAEFEAPPALEKAGGPEAHPVGSSESEETAGPAKEEDPAGPYDADRLEQTGWRLYESVVAKVRDDANEVSAAGVPASAASYAAAVLALCAPQSTEARLELMSRWHQLTASRTRAQRSRGPSAP